MSCSKQTFRAHVLAVRTVRSVLFFFQAEDGIRDLTVTGVQTCALPIFEFAARRRVFDAFRPIDAERRIDSRCDVFHDDGALSAPSGIDYLFAIRVRGRSEERRVGKECRSRWSPYH